MSHLHVLTLVVEGKATRHRFDGPMRDFYMIQTKERRVIKTLVIDKRPKNHVRKWPCAK